MTKRLNQILSMIPLTGKGIIDVGTDHGLIPIALSNKGYQGSIIASDLRSGPLSTARWNAATAGVEDRIQFLLCDGLEDCPAEKVDTILIAGMGGDTICGILDRTEWLFDDMYRLILQPMRKAEVLRYWLVHNDFRIEREAIVREDGHVYQIFTAVKGKSESFTDAEYLIGSFSMPREGENLRILLEEEIRHLKKRMEGIRHSGREDPFWRHILEELEDIDDRLQIVS